MLLLALLLVLGGGASVVLTMSTKVTYHLGEADSLFEKFILDYNRTYENVMEKEMRLKIFKQTLITINKLNEGLKKPVHGITMFADFTPEEFKSYKGYECGKSSCYDGSCVSVNLEEIHVGDAPDSFDWRDKNVVTPVKDQARCGSCWAFSTTGNVESQYAIKHSQLVELSEQQLVDCDTRSLGCKGGLPSYALNYLMNNNGAASEQGYPYVGQQQQCNAQVSKVVTVTGCTQFPGVSEDQMKELVYKYGPLSIGVCASETWQTYHGGVMADCPACQVDHAVLLVGYGTEGDTPYWIIKNSWGQQIGEQGYFRIKRGVNACNILSGQIVTSSVG